jgi:hypothetical protein
MRMSMWKNYLQKKDVVEIFFPVTFFRSVTYCGLVEKVQNGSGYVGKGMEYFGILIPSYQKKRFFYPIAYGEP